MNALNPYRVRLAVITHDFQMAVLAKRPFILGDLIALGQVWVEVVLSGKTRSPVDRAA